MDFYPNRIKTYLAFCCELVILNKLFQHNIAIKSHCYTCWVNKQLWHVKWFNPLQDELTKLKPVCFFFKCEDSDPTQQSLTTASNSFLTV